MIVMQPDDFPFFAEWTPPPKNPMSGGGRRSSFAEFFPNNYSMPNLEMLRTQGLQMMQAYAASSMCATSRFSTITGRYPSRSGVSRKANFNETVSSVSVPNTKLHDVYGQAKDCTEDNIAAVLKSHGYRTGVVGKWHLSETNSTTYTYENAQDEIKECGFDYVDGLYVENLNFFNNRNISVSHNHEWVTAKAIEFINDTGDKDEKDQKKPFFLYFNPTVPHPSGDVATALQNFTCRQTTNGLLEEEPLVPKMTAEYPSCQAYRDTIFERAGNSTSAHDLGSIWIDDSVGALIHTLKEMGELENTIFLFQLDHGVEAKSTHWENGNRIAQFIHYPNEFGTNGLQMTLPVSTIDVTPTLLEFANVDPDTLYEMDGKSWKNAYKEESGLDVDNFSSRCLMSELRKNRSLVCNKCHKFIKMNEFGSTTSFGNIVGLATNSDEMYFNLCSGGKYINYPDNSTEALNVAFETWDIYMTMKDVLNCMLEKMSPLNPPDFSLDICSFSDTKVKYDGISAPPALEPTANPTSSPTLTHSPSFSSGPAREPRCRDASSPFMAKGKNAVVQLRDCEWVGSGAKGGPGSRRCNKNGDKCPVTCNLC